MPDYGAAEGRSIANSSERGGEAFGIVLQSRAGLYVPMNPAVQVASPPTKPLMIFDGDCTFCTLWIRRWQQATGDAVEYVPSQDPRVAQQFPELPAALCAAAVCLVEPDGKVYSGAAAVFRALAGQRAGRWLMGWYERWPGFARVAEAGYGLVARHRPFFSLLTRIAWGRHLERPTHRLVRSGFLGMLGVIYLIAFVSLWVQVLGLIGSHGIIPAKLTMAAANQQADAGRLGWDRYHLLPTLCWWNSGDRFLETQCAAGAGLAVLLIAGVAPAPCLFGLWLLYLSLTTVGREFLGFQWDNLLLETGFLAIFFAPLRMWRTAAAPPPSRLMLWALRWLLFRLMFASGCVKLLSGDPTWHNLTALYFHYETQPLPTWIGWYAHQLPHWFQQTSTATMFFIELGLPFLIFAPRCLRQWACAGLVCLQIMIALTGNYCFFNLLAVALCLLLLDDAALGRFFPLRWPRGRARSQPPPASTASCERPAEASPESTGAPSQRVLAAVGSAPAPAEAPASTGGGRHWRWPGLVTIPVAGVALLVPLMQFSGMFHLGVPWPEPAVALYRWLGPFRSFNSYGLFAVMTTSRREIVVEGSQDGVAWQAYEFKYKPGQLNQRPRFVEPHQPRLDWQMWFAALSEVRQEPWFLNFCVRLLQGSPEVLALLEKNPFPSGPPRYIRAVAYQYHFTDWQARRRTGEWWRREPAGEYMPQVSLRAAQPGP